jgi:hypothetical protein
LVPLLVLVLVVVSILLPHKSKQSP